MSISKLFQSSVTLVKRDPIVLVPFLSFFFLSQVFHQHFPSFLGSQTEETSMTALTLLVARWVVQLFVNGYTLFLVMGLLTSGVVNVSGAFKRTLARFLDLFLASSILMIPFVFLYFYTQFDFSKLGGLELLVTFFILILFVPVSVMLQFIPVFIVDTSQSWQAVLFDTVAFIRRTLRELVWLYAAIFLITLIALILSSLFFSVPLIGQAVMSGGVLAVSSTLISIMSFLFYRERKTTLTP